MLKSRAHRRNTLAIAIGPFFEGTVTMTMNHDVHRRTLLKGAATLLGAAVPFAIGRTETTSMHSIVETSTGKVRGRRSGDLHVFKGIPYGANTAAHRFMAPIAAPAWPGVRDTLEYGPRAPQPPRAIHPLLSGWQDGSSSMSEDCLMLNVWTRGLNDGGKRPVMVWFHGGGFGAGSGSNHVYDGAKLCERGDVVVLSVNHRLNAFGYLYLAELGGAEFADSGNAGLLDLVLALQWVRDNAAAFGGDPGNVTLFGESGGGGKVSYLLGMPAAQGLFHKAAIQSGGFLTAMSTRTATARAEAYVRTLGLSRSSLSQIKTLPAQRLIEALGTASTMADRMSFSPVTDGRTLPRDPFAPDANPLAARIPLLIGTTQWEYIFQYGQEDPANFSLTWDQLAPRLTVAMQSLAIPGSAAEVIAQYRKMRPQFSASDVFFAAVSDGRQIINSIRLAERKAAQAASVYMYRLTWNTPVDEGKWKSPHALDIPFVFDNAALAKTMTGAGPEQDRLGAQMSEAWIAFARTGAPSTKLLPQWPTFDANGRATMIFDGQSRIEKDPDGIVREYWQSMYGRG